MVIRVQSRKVIVCSKIKETTYKEKTSLYSDRIFITKSIHYRGINTRVVYILQLPMLQELSTSTTYFRPIKKLAKSTV